MDRITDITAGQLTDDMNFSEQVWALTARIPRGKVTTYGAIARALGKPQASRAVGQALGRNPYAPDVPCHRVVGTNGKLTGFAGGLPRKVELLQSEGVAVIDQRVNTSDAYPFDQ